MGKRGFDLEKIKNIERKESRYPKQLDRMHKDKLTTKYIEETVKKAVDNLNNNIRSFVIYGDPQSGKTEMMIALTAKLLDEPLTVIEHIFVAGAGLWHLGISVLILISLPASIFKSIRNRLSKKQFLPIPFMTGLSFGFTFMGALGLIAGSL